MYHFSDHVIDGKYGFDYLIHSGAARTHNAIQLLKFSQYPDEVIKEAELLADQLTKATDTQTNIAQDFKTEGFKQD